MKQGLNGPAIGKAWAVEVFRRGRLRAEIQRRLRTIDRVVITDVDEYGSLIVGEKEDHPEYRR